MTWHLWAITSNGQVVFPNKSTGIVISHHWAMDIVFIFQTLKSQWPGLINAVKYPTNTSKEVQLTHLDLDWPQSAGNEMHSIQDGICKMTRDVVSLRILGTDSIKASKSSIPCGTRNVIHFISSSRIKSFPQFLVPLLHWTVVSHAFWRHTHD